MFKDDFYERARGPVVGNVKRCQRVKWFFVPTLLVMAMLPVTAALAVGGDDEYIDTDANYGGHGNVPFAGDYGNVAEPNGNNVFIGGNVPNGVFAGWVDTGTVENNRLTISGGKIGNDAYGGFVQTQGDVKNNQVLIVGGEAERVDGGYTEKGNVSGNHIRMTDGVVGGLNGASTVEGVGRDNSVTLDGGHVRSALLGADVYAGDAIGNRVTISGGRVEQYVAGGFITQGGNATENHVVISGAPVIEGEIYGGYVDAVGMATKNTVTLATDTNADFRNNVIYGGYVLGGGDQVSGNTLNVETSHVALKNIGNFEKINFHLNDAAVTGTPVLELLDTGGTQLQGVKINASGTIAGGRWRTGRGSRLSETVTVLSPMRRFPGRRGLCVKGFRWITVSGWKATGSVSMRC